MSQSASELNADEPAGYVELQVVEHDFLPASVQASLQSRYPMQSLPGPQAAT
jgi:hypothetical protein